VNGRASQKFVSFGLADGTEKALAIGAKADPDPLLDHCRAGGSAEGLRAALYIM
jgi:hypothetical protein